MLLCRASIIRATLAESPYRLSPSVTWSAIHLDMEAAQLTSKHIVDISASIILFLVFVANLYNHYIISYGTSSIASITHKARMSDALVNFHVVMLLTWTVPIQIVGTNTSAIIVVVDDYNSQKRGPSIYLPTHAIWTSYLVFSYSRQPSILASSTDYDYAYLYF